MDRIIDIISKISKLFTILTGFVVLFMALVFIFPPYTNLYVAIYLVTPVSHQWIWNYLITSSGLGMLLSIFGLSLSMWFWTIRMKSISIW